MVCWRICSIYQRSKRKRGRDYYYNRALSSDEGAAAAGSLYVKLSERRAVLMRLNSPQASASISIRQATETAKISSTERFMGLLNRVRAMPLPEPEEGHANGETDSNP